MVIHLLLFYWITYIYILYGLGHNLFLEKIQAQCTEVVQRISPIENEIFPCYWLYIFFCSLITSWSCMKWHMEGLFSLLSSYISSIFFDSRHDSRGICSSLNFQLQKLSNFWYFEAKGIKIYSVFASFF
jgi:hypothetical protein